jgi:hypothetical protein
VTPEPRDERADDTMVERAVSPFFRDSGLWPVTAVVIAHLVLGVAVLLLEAARGPGAFSLTALVAAALGSLAVLARAAGRRRLGPLGATVLVSWALGALAAWGADRAGLY